MIKKVIYGLLNADASYRDAIGVDGSGNVKLYPGVAPQGVQRPYATYTYVSRTEDHNKDQRGVITYSVQVDHWDDDEVTAATADEACISALDRYKGTIAGVKVMSIRVEGGGAGFDDGTESRRRMSEFTMKINP